MIAWWNNNLTLIHQICIYAIAAASVQLAMNAGVFSLLSGASWLLGCYAAAIAVREGASTWLAFLVAMAVGGGLGLLVSLATRRVAGIGLAMVTMSVVLITGLVLESLGDFTGGAVGLFGIPARVSTDGALAFVVGTAVLLTFLERGRMGRMMAAIREDPHIAASVGIPVTRARHMIMLVSNALAAMSGAIYAFMFFTITPTQGGFQFVLLLLSMVIVGGSSSWRGAYVGAALLLWLPNVSSVANQWNGVVYGLLLVIMVVFAPSGLTGLVGSGFRYVVAQLRRIAPRAMTRSVPEQEA